MADPQVQLGTGVEPGEAELQGLVADRFATRLFDRDASLWGESAESEAAVRLGWVDACAHGDATVAEVEVLRAELNAAGVDRVVLCGMGGSSLAPEVICHRDWAPLTILDSSHPSQVRRALADPQRTVVVVSSKSGSTIETRSQLAAFEAAFAEAGIDASARVVVVTDPGSALHDVAKDRGYRAFLGDPEVGGRYSALTPFGLVPAVLAGADARSLLAEAAAAAELLRLDSPENPALRLAAALSAALPRRYLGLHESQVHGTPLADWIEQLVAESTGKQGTGILPIALPQSAPELAGRLPETELLVELRPAPGSGEPLPGSLSVSGPLGGQFMLWEVATAALGRLLGVNPFDQPDVEAAKVAARAALEQSGTDGESPNLDPTTVASTLRAAMPNDGYLAIQAFLDRATEAPLVELRDALVRALGVPVSLGYGPRYLHSTGQFHKGGPACGVFLQIVDDGHALATADLPIPGSDAGGFAALVMAQARGDRTVLEELGRPVFVMTADQVAAALAALTAQLDQ